ncbi:Alpha/beta hydrolase-3 [Melia azedarach]|uniref:Alpha/beta hydrolase-3 n=1 Tax=Melia azedarach TaxID=155640 RepID=A0ACC1X3X2_MELAZ|nr:Alpha/beta hydrolase-3 [Melia azedarach]
MSDEISSPSSTIDPYEHLQIVANPDGTITRNGSFPNTVATPDPANNALVLSKDVPVNKSNNVWVRIFLPHQLIKALDFSSSSSNSNRLPLIVYYHGGGFVFCSAASSMFHVFCSGMAVELPAVVVSVEYRLAPENRLPAAYDDAMETLHWIKNTQEEWLTNYADFSCCFLMGGSAGGNIAYYAGLRAAAGVEDLTPLKIRGLILHHPYFGGVKRTESELRLANDSVLQLRVNDLLWELSLPIGADRDHEYCNPTAAGSESKMMEKIKLLGWKVLVTGFYGDPLVDRQIELVKMMKQIGVEVEDNFGEGGSHGLEVLDPSKAKALNLIIKDFISSTKLAA